MSYQEKRSVVSLISTILISVLYLAFVLQRYPEAVSATSVDFGFWASVILIYIPVQVVFKVIIYVVFSILNTVATHEEAPSITDEFDRIIDLKSTRNFYHVFMAGFLLSLLALAAGQPPLALFLGIMASMIMASVILGISQFYFYRRGV